jgi:rubrerythrin
MPKTSLLLAIILEAACAWTQIPVSKRQKITAPSRSRMFAAPTDEDSSFAAPEEECYDLCEIDLDLMPSIKEEDNEDQQEEEEDNAEGSREDEDEHSESFQRMRLELQWGMRENQKDCDLDHIETCGEYCDECTGLGWVPCHFCRGSMRLNVGENVLGPTSVKCPICKTGAINCQKCRGSGRIASWTAISNSTIT